MYMPCRVLSSSMAQPQYLTHDNRCVAAFATQLLSGLRPEVEGTAAHGLLWTLQMILPACNEPKIRASILQDSGMQMQSPRRTFGGQYKKKDFLPVLLHRRSKRMSVHLQLLNGITCFQVRNTKAPSVHNLKPRRTAASSTFKYRSSDSVSREQGICPQSAR